LAANKAAPATPESLPPKRKWLGYSVVTAGLLITFALWIGAMWHADDWYDDPWKYPAKVGSHGTVFLMCWAFILSTRFRWVERLFGGLDKVYKAHRLIGECAFFLIFLHPISLALGHSDTTAEFFRFLWFSGDWGRNTGLIALALFALLVVLSIYVKIAYHLWKRSHDFFGILLVLVVVHALIAGGEITTYPALAVWHGFWVATGLISFAYIGFFYRFIGPQYDYTTQSVQEIGDNITEMHLAPAGRPLRPQPGQFVYISFDADAVSKEPHPFSISSPPDARNLRLSIKRLGDWTEDVSEIKVGKPARISGPYGHFSKVILEEQLLPAVMIGGGIGITPFLSIVGSEAFASRLGKSMLIYSTNDQASAVYRDELRERAKELPMLTLVEHYSDEAGYIDRAYLESLLDRPLPEYLFMICGPKPMMDGLRDFLTNAGVKTKQILTEDFQIR
jgi:predicted ferric reductase